MLRINQRSRGEAKVAILLGVMLVILVLSEGDVIEDKLDWIFNS